MASTVYEFQVDGRLPEHARDYLGDMRIEELPAGLLLRVTVLDESHLHGIVAQLQALGLTVVSAQPVVQRR